MIKRIIYFKHKSQTDLTRKQKYGLHLLEERLQEPFCPASYFALNKSTFLAMFSTSLTYIIILLQFKVGDMTGDPTDGSGQMRYNQKLES